MADKKVEVNLLPGVIGMLGVLFVGLKLAGVINWSWWWVTLPFWGGLALVAVIAVIAIPLLMLAKR
jgi:hypothetical protein